MINSSVDYSDDEDGPKIEDINLTNQIIGEVQGFILVMRWLVYEFYNLKSLKQRGYLKAADFEAIEEDVLFMIHKMTVIDEVFDSLLVLTRLLNNIDDRKLRHKFKKLEEKKKRLFPLEQGGKVMVDQEAELHQSI